MRDLFSLGKALCFSLVLLFSFILLLPNQAYSQAEPVCGCWPGGLDIPVNSGLDFMCNSSTNSISIAIDQGIMGGCENTLRISANNNSTCTVNISGSPVSPGAICFVTNLELVDADGVCLDDIADFCEVDLLDTDNDGTPDVFDSDDDNDGVEDGDDADPLDNFICSDIDNDTCDDCSQGEGQDPSNDGPDSNGDGICDAGEPSPCNCDDPEAITEGFEFRGKTYFFGTFGDDTICGTPQRDVIFAFSGDDCVDSGDENDKVFLGFGDDMATLGDGDDRAFGGPGNDDIEGGEGEDSANGGFGEDYCDAETTNRCEVGPEE